MLWLGVHLPLLPLEVFGGGASMGSREIRDRGREAELRSAEASSAPTVVLDGRGRVVLRNPAAIDAGIARGSTLATAHSIVPELVHYRRSPELEGQRLALLGEILYGFSARVSLAPPACADEPASGIMLEIGGSLRLFGDAAELVRQVEATCRELGHAVRLRLASTPLAALTLARAGADDLNQVHLSHAAVEPGRLPPEVIERFANMGVHTLGQLLALPARGLARRFDTSLVDFLDRLAGKRPDPRPVIRPAEHFRTAVHLLDPLNSKEAVTFPMQHLLTSLQHWLVTRQLGTEQLRWCFTGSSGERVWMPVRFTHAQQSREAFLDITRLQLAETALPEDVISLVLEARRLVPWGAASRSGGLFGHLPGLQAADDVDDLGELVDQLRARLGRNACYSLEISDQHTPEQAWQRMPPLQRARGEAGASATPRRRPLWLFDPPRAVHRGQLELLRGPERIHTGWWLTGSDTAGEARDYYVARHVNGARCWVFTDPSEKWFLHGYFS